MSIKKSPFLKIILLFFVSFLQITDSKGQNDIARQADSLFKAKNFSSAANLYELVFNDKGVNNRNISLKLSYIYENQGNYPKALYYLNSYYNLRPADEVFDKMNKIALMNKYTGYERDNINFTLAIYQQFYIFILYGMLFLGAFLLWILYNKKKNHKPIHRKNWIVVTSYFVLLALLINGPTGYKSAIVMKTTYLREFPSSAAPVVGEITPGNKINIFGKDDVWQKAYWQNKIVYVNQNEVRMLEN